MKKCNKIKVMFGCDPELFFKRRGHVVGSENVIKTDSSLVVKDGVQGELNPQPSQCRTLMMGHVRHCFFQIQKLTSHNKVKVSSDVTVNVSKRHFNTLDEDSKKFGCMPSFNAHTKEAGVMELDPEIYLSRSAGGHIHLGTMKEYPSVNAVLSDPERTIPILDIILGNTMVLLDRDIGNVERRKHYGQAGEYRTPPHGLEYRVLSNFWLRGTPLMSLAFGLARHAVLITEAGLDKELLKLVDMDDVVKAINTNDKALAQKNFDKVRQFMVDSGDNTSFFPLNQTTLPAFDKLVKDGIDKHFNKGLVDTWTKDMKYLGFTDFALKMDV